MTLDRRVKAVHRREIDDTFVWEFGNYVLIRQHIDIVRIKRFGQRAHGTARVVRTDR